MPSVMTRPSRSFGGAGTIGKPAREPMLIFGISTPAFALPSGFNQHQMHGLDIARCGGEAGLWLLRLPGRPNLSSD